MNAALKSFPQNDGYRMPGEFEPHKGCWMIWPQRGDSFRLKGKPAQKTFVKIAEAIQKFERLSIIVSKDQYETAKSALPQKIRLVQMETDDAWIRDTGPSFVINKDGDVRGIDWDFNAWGGIFSPCDKDALVAKNIMSLEKILRYDPSVILEGGSFHVDGQGTLITTEQCLLNPNRNPDFSKDKIESLLKSYLNVDTVIWIKDGVFMDETAGHVDNLCAFAQPGEIVLTWTEDPKDPQYEISRQAFDILSNTKDAKGRSFKIHKIHQPGPLYITPEESKGFDSVEDARIRKKWERLAGSYVNFYMANKGIVMPLFNDPHDKQAMTAMEHIFPGREIIGIETREILLGGGNIHCMTQQEPKSA